MSAEAPYLSGACPVEEVQGESRMRESHARTTTATSNLEPSLSFGGRGGKREPGIHLALNPASFFLFFFFFFFLDGEKREPGIHCLHMHQFLNYKRACDDKFRHREVLAISQPFTVMSLYH